MLCTSHLKPLDPMHVHVRASELPGPWGKSEW